MPEIVRNSIVVDGYCVSHTLVVRLDKWGGRKNSGFIRMSDMAEKIRCIEQMNGQVVEELGHNPLTVRPASSDTGYSRIPRYVVF